MMRQTTPSMVSFRCCKLWRLFSLLCIVSMFTTTLATAQEQKKQSEFFHFLKRNLEFSTDEFERVKEGKGVTKLLKTNVRHELAVFSIAKCVASREFFIRNYMKKEMNIDMAAAGSLGVFSAPPGMKDVKTLIVPLSDLKDLLKCQPGDCKVKTVFVDFERFRRLHESQPDFEIQANRLIRQRVVRYVQGYLDEGDSSLVEYRDKRNPILLSQEFRDLLKESPYVYKYRPELHKYLLEFPKSELPPNAKETLFWMKEAFGDKTARPVITINHMVAYRPPGAVADLIIASKQLFANHYFEAALGLTAMVDDVETSSASFYLLHIHRIRLDILRKIPRFLAKRLHNGARDLIHKKMTLVKKNLDRAYRKAN